MVYLRVKQLIRPILKKRAETLFLNLIRKSTECSYGALKPQPDKTTFGLTRVTCAVIPGIFIGAVISKSVANFLEENDLFVPADDDDDDD